MNLALENLAAYSMQIAVLVAAGTLLPAALRLRLPRALLAWRQMLLAACLLLPAIQPWRTQAAPARARVSLAPVTAAALSPAQTARPAFPVALCVFAAIGAGIGLRLLWLALGWRRLRRYRASATPASELIEPSAPARFYVSDQIDGPVTFGLRPATILLPRRFLQMTAAQQAAIVCHELQHVRRRDWLATLFEEIVRALLWFHPAVWWLLERIRLNREQVVDSEVVRLTAARKPYLEALLEIAVERSRLAPALLRKRHLAQRVALIVKEVTMPTNRLIVTLSAVFAVVALAGALAVRSFPLQAQEKETLHRVGGGVTAPVLLSKVEPKYTEEARSAGVHGTVTLMVEVWPDGAAHNIRVLKSLDPGLDKNAASAVEQWTFKPGSKDGEPVKVQATIEVNFRLGDGPPPQPQQENSARPTLIYRVEPQYTQEARDAKIEGDVVLSVEVTADGRTENIRVVRGLDPGLDQKAVEAVEQWRFKPATKDGQPVTTAATIEVRFRLK